VAIWKKVAILKTRHSHSLIFFKWHFSKFYKKYPFSDVHEKVQDGVRWQNEKTGVSLVYTSIAYISFFCLVPLGKQINLALPRKKEQKQSKKLFICLTNPVLFLWTFLFRLFLTKRPVNVKHTMSNSIKNIFLCDHNFGEVCFDIY